MPKIFSHFRPIVFRLNLSEDDSERADVLRSSVLCDAVFVNNSENLSWPQLLKTAAQADSLRDMKPRAAPRPSNGYRVSLSAVTGIMSEHFFFFFCTHRKTQPHILCLSSKTLAYIYCLVWSWSPNRILISNDLLNVFLIFSPEQHNDLFSLFTFGPKALMLFAWVG